MRTALGAVVLGGVLAFATSAGAASECRQNCVKIFRFCKEGCANFTGVERRACKIGCRRAKSAAIRVCRTQPQVCPPIE